MSQRRSVKSILVRSPNWIGDQILAYPFFHYLRKAYPQARITVACVPWVSDIQFRNLIDETIILPRAANRTLSGRWDAVEAAAREIREQGPWDLGFCLPNSLSSAWMMFRARVRERRGYAADGRGLLLKPGLSWAKRTTVHRAEDYVGLLPPEAKPARPVRAFWGLPAENELDPRIPGEVSGFDALKAWPEAEVIEPPSEPYWVLAPGSQAESRRWPAQSFARLAREILSARGWRGVIVGGAGEATLARDLVSDRSLGLIDRTAQGTVASNWKIFANARFTVSNDSGLAHVAALCGSPTQIVWGAGDPKRTEPLGPGKVRVMFNPIECWPCERNFCALPAPQKIDCLRGIQPAEVWKEIQSGLRI